MNDRFTEALKEILAFKTKRTYLQKMYSSVKKKKHLKTLLEIKLTDGRY